eukprot:3837609-Prymnesium_polylepis.1
MSYVACVGAPAAGVGPRFVTLCALWCGCGRCRGRAFAASPRSQRAPLWRTLRARLDTPTRSPHHIARLSRLRAPTSTIRASKY